MRIFWLVSGIVFVALGIIGLVLPLLPTTPFILLATYCFAKSSERLHNWITSHPTFGPSIHNWQKNGSIGKKAKITAVCFMLAALLLSFILEFSLLIISVQTVVLLGVSAFILSRPTTTE